MTSISPVGRLRVLRCPRDARDTSPVTFRQYSLRRLCATASSRITTWTTPLASRRSMNATPPWSRRRATQPARVTVWPTSLGAQGCRRHGCGSLVLLLWDARWLMLRGAGPRPVGSRSAGSAACLVAGADVLDLRRAARRRAGNQTYGMPRRSAYRICLPNFCGGGGDLAGHAGRARSCSASASLAARRLLVDERDEDGAGHRPVGRRRPRLSSGTSSRLTPSEMPTPGYVVRPSVASASYRPPEQIEPSLSKPSSRVSKTVPV